jgi:hypothetical protein
MNHTFINYCPIPQNYFFQQPTLNSQYPALIKNFIELNSLINFLSKRELSQILEIQYQTHRN